ncbi:MAG: transcription termination/antitermination NusG family protein [Terracidiphilus sp.]
MHENHWHVLHVRSNFEKRVADHLAVRAVEHYLPLYRERVRWSDRTIIAERPLFSGYVFARFLSDARINVISIPGVVRLLGDDGASLVSSDELDKIRAGLTSGLLLRPHPDMAVGTRVRILRGIFEGVEGVVSQFRQQCKVVIALGSLQPCFSLEVDSGNIAVHNQPLAKKSLALASAEA